MIAGDSLIAGEVGAVWGILLAAGGGSRFGGPKQHADLGGRSLQQWALATALASCDGVVLVTPDGTFGHDAADSAVTVVAGGAVRAESVRAGLAAVPPEAGIVVVADVAHPLASDQLYRRVIAAVRAGAEGAVPGLPLTEAVTTVDEGAVGVTHPAAGHVLVQTPQAFRTDVLRAAHAHGAVGVEDSSMAAATGARVVIVPGDPANLHVTTPEELELARLLAGSAQRGEMTADARRRS